MLLRLTYVVIMLVTEQLQFLVHLEEPEAITIALTVELIGYQALLLLALLLEHIMFKSEMPLLLAEALIKLPQETVANH